MTLDTPQVQRGIAKWTLIATILLGGLTYLLGATRFAYGLVFGVVISVVNYKVVGWILDVAMRGAYPDIARVIGFVGYHVRFWVLVIVLYLVIPRTHYLFGVGTFFGLLLPKVIIGVFMVIYTDDEWWNRPAECSQSDEGTIKNKKDQNTGFEDSEGDLKV